MISITTGLPRITVSNESAGSGRSPPSPVCTRPSHASERSGFHVPIVSWFAETVKERDDRGYCRLAPFTRIRTAYSPFPAVMNSVVISFPPKHTFAVHGSGTSICATFLPALSNTVTPLPVR